MTPTLELELLTESVRSNYDGSKDRLDIAKQLLEGATLRQLLDLIRDAIAVEYPNGKNYSSWRLALHSLIGGDRAPLTTEEAYAKVEKSIHDDGTPFAQYELVFHPDPTWKTVLTDAIAISISAHLESVTT